VGFSPRVTSRNFGLLHAFLSDQASPGALAVKVHDHDDVNVNVNVNDRISRRGFPGFPDKL